MGRLRRFELIFSSLLLFSTIFLFALAGSCFFEPAGTILNPYRQVDWDSFQQYKANFHCHTSYSDGILKPHRMIDAYHEEGYSILSLTDHDTHNRNGPLTYPWNKLRYINSKWENRYPEQLHMVAVQGVEISATRHIASHFNDFPGEGSDNEDHVLTEIEKRGGLAQFCHPGRYTEDDPVLLVDWYADLYRRHDCLVGIEIYSQRDRHPKDRQFWDNLLMEVLPEKTVWGFANDDSHGRRPLRAYCLFILEELNVENVKEAYKNGVFFACYRTDRNAPALPAIRRITVENRLFASRITIDAEGYGQMLWIANGEVVHRGPSIDISFNSDWKYVRAKLIEKDGGEEARVLSQPFVIIKRQK